jgi:small nuclear ribonucleoprotein (snRNP)-like protein
MTTNGQTWILVVVSIALTTFAVLGIKGCIDKKVVIPGQIQKTSDSVNTWAKDAEKVIDSLIVVTKEQSRSKDSLKAIKERQEQELYIKGNKIAMLVKQAQLQALYKDTAAELRTVDTLLPQIAIITHNAEDYLHQNRLLQNSYDSLLSTNSLAFAKLDYDNSVLKENFDKVAATGIEIEKQNAKLSKKKRFGIGPQIGYIFDGFKGRPGISIGLHWSLIRF